MHNTRVALRLPPSSWSGYIIIDLGFALVTLRLEETDPLCCLQRKLCFSAVRPVHCASSQLVVIAFEKDVECMIYDL